MCRFVLYHAMPIGKDQGLTDANLIYLPVGQHQIPNWINNTIENANWSKGKLSCPKCNGRVGAFDFISSADDHRYSNDNHQPKHTSNVWIHRCRVDEINLDKTNYLPTKTTTNSNTIRSNTSIGELALLTQLSCTSTDNYDTEEILDNGDNHTQPNPSLDECPTTIIQQPIVTATKTTRKSIDKAHKGKIHFKYTSNEQNSECTSAVQRKSKDNHKHPKSYVNIKAAKVIQDEIADTSQNIPENMICPICLDVYYRPYRCNCGHIFCDFCLRLLVKNKMEKSDPNVLCPLCRQSIKYVDDCKELKQKIKQQFNKNYIHRRIEIKRALMNSKLPMPFKKGKLGKLISFCSSYSTEIQFLVMLITIYLLSFFIS